MHINYDEWFIIGIFWYFNRSNFSLVITVRFRGLIKNNLRVKEV